MPDKETILFGIPIPTDNKLFLAIVAVHIVLGIICVMSGIVAMLSRKGDRVHRLSGRIYFWGLLLVFLTVVPLTIMRWPFNNHLFLLGALSTGSAYFGRSLARMKRPGWTRVHTWCMGLSYVFLLTAFYVDNGKNLPFWNQFPYLFFWIFPVAIGLPIISYAVLRHPLNRR